MSQKTARRKRAEQQRTEFQYRPSRKGGAAGIPRSWLYGGLAALAVVIVVVLVVASQVGGDDATPRQALDATQVNALLDGIPQDGIALGSPDAPVVLVEFADLQCPFCKRWASDVLPVIVQEYVRPGDVRLEFRGLSFLGDDSVTALRTALAAGEQDRLWHVVDLLYQQQGGENEGWVTEGLLAAIGDAVPGLDRDTMLGDRSSGAVDDAMAAAVALADQMNIRTTPSFLIGRAGEEQRVLDVSNSDLDGFRAALDELLGR